MTRRFVIIGTGAMGSVYCRQILPPFIADGTLEPVAAVDVDRQALEAARSGLGLPDDRLYTELSPALERDADFCIVVTPPATHEEVVVAALDAGLDVLCEKPIADTLAAATRIAGRVSAAGRKMAVTMSHRFDLDKRTLCEAIRCGEYGPVDYVVCNHTVDRRKYGSWGEFRSRIGDVQMIEGGVHYLDIIADLAASRCTSIYAQTWNPAWSEFAGDPQSLAILTFANGARGFLEACAANATELYPWGHEHWRVECERGTVILDNREIEAFRYDPSIAGNRRIKGQGEHIAPINLERYGHSLLVEQFVRWIEGGPPMPTNVHDNLQSVALFEAAIMSSRTGQAVAVQEYIESVRKEQADE